VSNDTPISFPFSKRWPKGGQNWDIKEKRFCVFTHVELLAKPLVGARNRTRERSPNRSLLVDIVYFNFLQNILIVVNMTNKSSKI